MVVPRAVPRGDWFGIPHASRYCACNGRRYGDTNPRKGKTMEPAAQASESNVANALADYRFCAYRLAVLEESRDSNAPAIAAVAARMARLAIDYPAIGRSVAAHHRK